MSWGGRIGETLGSIGITLLLIPGVAGQSLSSDELFNQFQALDDEGEFTASSPPYLAIRWDALARIQGGASANELAGLQDLYGYLSVFQSIATDIDRGTGMDRFLGAHEDLQGLAASLEQIPGEEANTQLLRLAIDDLFHHLATKVRLEQLTTGDSTQAQIDALDVGSQAAIEGHDPILHVLLNRIQLELQYEYDREVAAADQAFLSAQQRFDRGPTFALFGVVSEFTFYSAIDRDLAAVQQTYLLHGVTEHADEIQEIQSAAQATKAEAVSTVAPLAIGFVVAIVLLAAYATRGIIQWGRDRQVTQSGEVLIIAK